MYCPKCDMEFVEGITVCTDCKGPLVDKEEWLAEQKEIAEAEAAEEAAMRAEKAEQFKELMENVTPEDIEQRREQFDDMVNNKHTYVDESEKYSDNKSSAIAFFIVGGLLVVFSILLWTGVIKFGLIMNICVTVFAVAAIVFGIISNNNANKHKDLIESSHASRKAVVDDFLDKYTAFDIDVWISKTELAPEELVLARMKYIEDKLITENDITDEVYAADLAEEIYNKLFEE